MKEEIREQDYIITFDDDIIDDLSVLNSKITKTPDHIKNIIFDLDKVKYVNSIFINYIMHIQALVEKNNIKLKMINCPNNIYDLFNKCHQDHKIEIKVKEL